MRNSEQNLNEPLEPVVFQVDRGTCPVGQVPVPTARMVGPSGLTVSAHIENFDQRREQLANGEAYGPSGSIVVTPREGGVTRLELVFPAATRSFDVNFVDALKVPRDFSVLGYCNAPIRVRLPTVTCSQGVIPGETHAYEAWDGGSTQLELGSRLWATPEGYLVSSDGGLGWLQEGVPLRAWAPTVVGLGDVRFVDATPEFVAVLTESELRLLARTDLSTVRASRAHLLQLGFYPQVTVGRATLVVYLDDAERRRQAFVIADGGLETTGPYATGLEMTVGSWAGRYWTCSTEHLRLYDVESNGVPLIDASRSTWSCGGDGYSDRPTLSGGARADARFVQCPFESNGRLSLVSIDPEPYEVAGCFGDYLVLRRDYEETTSIIDLRKYRP